MSTKNFFKPTILYKEYMILNLIEKDPNITQRHISTAINIAVSMVNSYIDMYEKQGLLEKEHISTKTVRYHITKKGIERRKLLNIWYLESANQISNQAKSNILLFLDQIIHQGYKNVILYGAGHVSEIILKALNDNNDLKLKVLAVIDDHPTASSIINVPIIKLVDIDKYKHDGILISSYTHHLKMYQKLIDNNYPKEKIIQFFES